MDPFSPIQGITLERYAALSAEIAAARGDASKVAAALSASGVPAADWEQAQAGWSARLVHPGLGPSVAPRFETLYHEALDRLLGPAPDVPPDDFAAMWGEALAVGLPAMWQERHLDPLAWSRVSHRCRAALAADPARLAATLAMAQLVAERRILGPVAAPRPAAAAPGARPASTPPGAPGAAAPAEGAGGKPLAQKFDQDATVAAKAVGKAFLSGLDAFGAAVDGLGKSLTRPGVGAAVLVQWSDGKRYPGTVAKVGDGQLMVTMADGSQHWIPDAYVKPA